jgi:hypothetical protein
VNITLEALLQRLVGRGNEIARQSPLKNDERVPTSIRLKPTTKHFLESQAEALNTSTHALIAMILDGVAETTTDDTAGQLRTIRERFFFLMQAHGLDLPAVVDLMKDFGFTLSALGSTERLLDLLTKPAIEHLANVFFIREEWLSAAGERAVSADVDARWYKEVPHIANRLLAYKRDGLRPTVMMIRRQGADFERACREPDVDKVMEPVGVVVRLERETPGGTPFKAYQLWEFERWNYWRCREQLKLLIAFCEQAKISLIGHQLPIQTLDALTAGHQLPVQLLSRLGSVSWHPDDYASFNFKVTREVGEWASVAAEYRKSVLPQLAQAAGAAPLPDKPWAPKQS